MWRCQSSKSSPSGRISSSLDAFQVVLELDKDVSVLHRDHLVNAIKTWSRFRIFRTWSCIRNHPPSRLNPTNSKTFRKPLLVELLFTPFYKLSPFFLSPFLNSYSSPPPLLSFLYFSLSPPAGGSLFVRFKQSHSLRSGRDFWRPPVNQEMEGKKKKERRKYVCVRESTLQISSINHGPESNVTNILQLEETRWSWGPSISLTPHDHRFIRAEERERGRPCIKNKHTHTQTHFAGHTLTHMQTLTHPRA